MMQQQMTQEQAMSQQQQQMAQQQMMLCPVRVVYETQILVPPGDQYQPNQTIFINPQNPPPWMNQNAQVVPQNQMLYVQQMPNNMVPSVQQGIDQNQIQYIQQAYPNMQPVLQNQNVVMAQNTPERQILRQPIQTIQFPNVPPDINNMNAITMNQYAQMINAQNMQNIQMQNMAQQQMMSQNMQNVQVNMPQMIQQVSNSPRPQQMQQNLIRTPIQNQNVRPNIQQNQVRQPVQQNVVIQPNMMMSQVQNVVQMPNQQQQQTRSPMPSNVRQTYVQNVRHSMPQQVNAPKQQIVQTNAPVQRNSPNFQQMRPAQPNYINTSNTYTVQSQPKPVNNKVPISNINVVNQNVNHQIRPRIAPMQPQQIRQNMPQIRPMPMQTQTQMPNNVQNQYVRPMLRLPVQENSITITPTMTIQPTNTSSTENKPSQPTENRKRKSESPDEFKNKVSVNCATQVAFDPSKSVSNMQTNTVRHFSPKPNISEVGVNTSPVHRPKLVPKTNTVDVRPPQPMQVSMPTQTTDMQRNQTPSQETDKLKRNTVFAQARTRKLSNTAENKTVVDNTVSVNTDVQMKEATPLPATIESKPIAPVVASISQTPTQIKTLGLPLLQNRQLPVNNTKIVNQIPTQVLHQEKIKVNTIEIKKEIASEPPEVQAKVELPPKSVQTQEVKKEEVKTIKVEKEKIEEKPVQEIKKEVKLNSLDEKIKSITDIKSKEIELCHGNKKSDKDNSFVLTHVLDGIVIQESNVAFPIRIPLREKVLNPPAVKEESKKELPTPSIEEPRPEVSKSSDSKIMTISKLNLEESDKEPEKSGEPTRNIDDHPFSSLKPQVIKSWTSEQLESHLSNAWRETASILREHEIDGEALFLVSSSQLLEIGINENHANIMCEFVKS